MDKRASSLPLIQAFSELGLNDVEARLYAHMFSCRPQSRSALEISNALQLPRTSVYDNLLKLCEKGFAQRIVRHKTLHFTANSVDFLELFIQQEKEKTDRLEKTLERIKTLVAVPVPHTAETQIRYYHGEQGIMQIMWNALSAKDEIIGYGSLGRFTILSSAFIQRFYDEFMRRHIRDRVIVSNTAQTLHYLSLLGTDEYRQRYREARIFPAGELHISGDTTIYNDIFSISYWEHGEIVGVEIQNEEFVKLQKSIFEIMWRTAIPVVFDASEKKNDRI